MACWLPCDLCCFCLALFELVRLDFVAVHVVAAAAAAAVVGHTVVEIFAVLTFAVYFDLGVRFFAAVFVDVAHVVVPAVAAEFADVAELDVARAEHDVVAAVAADVEGAAVDNASPLPWECLDFVGAAA